MRCTIVSLQRQTNLRGKIICGLFEKTHGLGFWLKRRKETGNEVQDNVKISPYKICFYAKLQGTPTVSLSWFRFGSPSGIPGCSVYRGFPQTAVYLPVWKAVTDFPRLESIPALAEILFLGELPCRPKQLRATAIVCNCVWGWATPWASCMTQGKGVCPRRGHGAAGAGSGDLPGAAIRKGCGNVLWFSLPIKYSFSSSPSWEFLTVSAMTGDQVFQAPGVKPFFCL